MSTKSISKACLFGGAITAAGMTAQAQPEFIIGETTHNHGIDTGPIAAGYAGAGSYDMTIDVGAAFGPTSASASFGTGTSAEVELSDTEISGSVEKSINSFGYFAFVTAFTVTEDTDVTVSWDAAEDVPTIDRRFRVWRSLGATLFEYDEFSGPHDGTVTISLTAGEQYWVDALYRSIWDNGTGSFSITIDSDTGRLCADQNEDGAVTPTDFTAWIANFNNNDMRADVNQSGFVEPTDFTAWINAFNQGASGPICTP